MPVSATDDYFDHCKGEPVHEDQSHVSQAHPDAQHGSLEKVAATWIAFPKPTAHQRIFAATMGLACYPDAHLYLLSRNEDQAHYFRGGGDSPTKFVGQRVTRCYHDFTKQTAPA